MAIFGNPFFSLKGQKERLSNVASTLKAAVTGQGVSANTASSTVNKVLSSAASNPFTTAGIAAVAINPAAAAGTVKAGFGALPLGGKVAAVVAAPVVVGAAVANPQLISKAGSAPKELSQFGGDVGSFIKNPSLESGKDVLKNSPYLSAGTALLGGALVGGGIAGTVATIANTRAVKENTKASLTSVKETVYDGGDLFNTPPEISREKSPSSPQSQPLTPETMVLGREVKTGTVVPRRRKVNKPRVPNVRVSVLNQNTYIDNK